MKYEIHVIEDEDEGYFYVVLEKQTEHVIDSFFFEEDAIEYCDFLNKGGAFDGNTPAFILNKVKIDINTEFNSLLRD
jgi:hypothetical protein